VTAVIQEEVNNLQKLASEFSQFAKLPAAVPAPYDLNAQLQELTTLYQSQANFTLHLDPDLSTFFGDKDQLKQVFTNLILNSIQSSDDQCHIEISTQRTRGGITITFQDNGKGILPEDLAKIFDPYFTRRTKGTGLGLSIVKRIVESHDGSIEVHSEVGTGTRFTLHFPIKDEH
jgi:two-component system nitrogen regulation sensor histidine kinase NtrY